VGDYDTIKAKLIDLEKSVTKLEGADRKIAHLESQVKKLERSLSKLTRPVTSKTKKRTYHEVRQGETLSRIAEKYNITVERLCRLNKITPKTVIRPGQRLLVSSGG
jgi:LysM repeat protein